MSLIRWKQWLVVYQIAGAYQLKLTGNAKIITL